jgi:hypothetical protein
MEKFYRTIAAGLIAAAIVSVGVSAQQVIQTPYVTLANPLYLTTSDYVMCNRGGITLQCGWSATINNLTNQIPVATRTANGIVHPGTNMTVDGTGALNVTVTSGSVSSLIGTTSGNPNPYVYGAINTGLYATSTSTIAVEIGGANSAVWTSGKETVTNLVATTLTGTTGNFPTLNFTNALGTTVTATTFNGALVGAVTGNVTGNLTGNVLATTVTGTTGNFPTLNFTNALGTTITATNGELTNILSTTVTGTTGNFQTLNFTNALGTTATVGTLNVTTCNGCSSTASLNNTTSNVTYYLNFTTTTGGTLSALYGSSSNFYVNASTGVLSATYFGIAGTKILSYGSHDDVTSLALGDGALSGISSTTAYDTALGYEVLSTDSTGIFNSGGGYYALDGVTTGSYNTAWGAKAGYTITTGSNNLVIGPFVGSTTINSGSNNILIGTTSAIDTTTSSASNEIVLGGSGGPWVTVLGTSTTSTQSATMNGNLAISGTTTVATLNITGSCAGCGSSPVYNHSGSTVSSPHIVSDSVSAGSSGSTVTLSSSALFSTATSYSCSCSSPSVNSFTPECALVQTSSSSFTVYNNGSATVNYTCVGN